VHPFDSKLVKTAARNSLEKAGAKHKNLVTLHTGAILLLTFALMLMDFLLEQKISTIGGLGGIGTRSTLATIQAVLRLSQLAVVPFWQVGYTYLTLRLSREESAGIGDLFEGFRRWGAVLRLFLLQAALYFGITFVSINISSSIFVMLPWAQPLNELSLSIAAGNELTTEALMAVMQQVALPLTLTTLVVLLPLIAPFYYRYRMSLLFLLDGEQNSALFAMRESQAWMKGHRIALFKLDLRFWWYYALELLVGAVSFLDLGLAALGIQLPWPSAVTTFVCFGLYAAAQLLLHRSLKNYVYVAYAQGYNNLIAQEEDTN